MDYSTEKYALIKNQWNLIHNPQATSGLLDGMEEGAIISKMIYDPNMKIGGLTQIVEYICKSLYNNFKEIFINHYKMAGNSLKGISYEFLLMDLFDNKIQIDIEQEAKTIITTVLQYMVKKEIMINETNIISYLDNTDFCNENELTNLFVGSLSDFAKNELVLNELESFVTSYFNTKAEIFGKASVSAQKSFVYSISSNQKFKNILRNVIKVPENRIAEIMELKHTNQPIPEIENYFKTNSNLSNTLKKQLSENIELKNLVFNNIENQKRAINATLKSNNFFKVINKSITLWDFSTALMDASRGNVSPATIIYFIPSYGLLAIVFEMEINRLAEDIETTHFENIHTWDEILNWKQSKACKYFNNVDILLQYTEEKDKYNNATPTSIRILDKELAKQIFGFYPKYVNYDFPTRNTNFVPRYYAPYINK